MQHSPAFVLLLIELEKYAEISQRLSPLDDLPAHFASSRASVDFLPKRKGAHFRKTAERYAKSLEQFLFVSLVSRRKIDAINHLIRYATETRNAIALAQGARSLVEHVAVQAEIVNAVSRFKDQLKGQTEELKIHDSIKNFETFLSRCYFGKSPAIEKEKSLQALHINDCIKTLDAMGHEFSESYDFLCDFVHPNHGSNSLVSSNDVDMQLDSIVTDMNRPETQKMVRIVLKALQISEELQGRQHGINFLLGFYAERFIQPGSKISNIFAVRKIKPIGDGKTKATAFFFPNVRDADETFELWQQYLKNRKIQVHSRHLAAYEEDSAYDLYETTQGQLWHRVEYPFVEGSERSEQ